MYNLFQQITIDFTDFNVEKSDDCTYDFVDVYNAGEEPSLLEHLCGYDLPDAIVSQEQKVLIVFFYDGYLSFKGLRALVTVRDESMTLPNEPSTRAPNTGKTI